MQAVILCGGYGKRLKPLTDNIPKPLVKINGTPIIDHIVNHLKNHSVRDIVLATGYKSEKIEDHFSTVPKDMSIKVINSGYCDILERIKSTREYIKEDFLLLYGDTISDIDINKLSQFHATHKNSATICVWPLKTQFGLVTFNKQKVVDSFSEKPVLNKWINIGYFLFRKDIMNRLNDYSDWLDLLETNSSNKSFCAYEHNGMHLTINTIQELHAAEEELRKGEVN